MFVNARINDDVAHRDQGEEELYHGRHAGVDLLWGTHLKYRTVISYGRIN